MFGMIVAHAACGSSVRCDVMVLTDMCCTQTREGIIAKRQWWRLGTCCFIHADVMHLMLNMQSLCNLGPGFERTCGTGRFLCVYAAGGICGSLFSLFLTPNPSLGASGGASF